MIKHFKSLHRFTYQQNQLNKSKENSQKLPIFMIFNFRSLAMLEIQQLF